MIESVYGLEMLTLEGCFKWPCNKMVSEKSKYYDRYKCEDGCKLLSGINVFNFLYNVQHNKQVYAETNK